MPFLKNKEFNKLLVKARNQRAAELPFVLYQKPNDNEVKAIFLENSSLVYTSNFTEEGFIFSAFDNKNTGILFPSAKIDSTTYKIEKVGIKESTIFSKHEKEFHIELVNKAVETIKSSTLKKVVLSRKLLAETEKDEFQLFQQLLNTYQNAFKYLWFHPEIGIWLGASPEVLLEIDDKFIITNSLAGTVPVIANQPPKWSHKEIEEQQLVTDFITENLSNKLVAIKTSKTKSIKAGKLWHLKSTISGTLKNSIGLKTILKALHPTPAICGLPKEAAKKFIIDNENYNREFYTGFLGELNLGDKKETYLYVNLRCMKLNAKTATIYIGGGITRDSIAENEWKETQYKSNTMLSLL